jgi:hypothetical protein
MIYYLQYLITYFFQWPQNVQVGSDQIRNSLASRIRNSRLRIRGSGSEINIYGSTTHNTGLGRLLTSR